MTGKEVIDLMVKNGWSVKRIKNNSYIMGKEDRLQTVPFVNRPLKEGLEAVILKNINLNKE